MYVQRNIKTSGEIAFKEPHLMPTRKKDQRNRITNRKSAAKFHNDMNVANYDLEEFFA